MSNNRDREILRALAGRIREIATDEHVNSTRALYIGVNGLKPIRPVVLMDELPWNQIESADETARCQCEGEYERGIELGLRRTLYKWDHFRCDMLVDPFYTLNHYVKVGSTGIEVEEDTSYYDKTNHIHSHYYHDMIPDEEALEKMHAPTIEVDSAIDDRNMERLEGLFGDILPIRLAGGFNPSYHAPWDRISTLRGPEKMLWDLVDRPEFTHAIMRKMTDIALRNLDIAEKLNLIDPYQPTVHCTPGLAPELPGEIKDGKITRANVWGRGMAQMFASVSPDMHDEFEMEYAREFFSGFGLTYYGCCEPLDRKMEIVKTLPNLRKVGVTPWANVRVCAEQLGDKYVMARKPNPASVAVPQLDEDALRQEIGDTLAICRETKTPVEFVLKDISSCHYNPRNLERWAAVAMDMVTR